MVQEDISTKQRSTRIVFQRLQLSRVTAEICQQVRVTIITEEFRRFHRMDTGTEALRRHLYGRHLARDSAFHHLQIRIRCVEDAID